MFVTYNRCLILSGGRPLYAVVVVVAAALPSRIDTWDMEFCTTFPVRYSSHSRWGWWQSHWSGNYRIFYSMQCVAVIHWHLEGIVGWWDERHRYMSMPRCWRHSKIIIQESLKQMVSHLKHTQMYCVIINADDYAESIETPFQSCLWLQLCTFEGYFCSSNFFFLSYVQMQNTINITSPSQS